jgi:natural product biosynthesis luciferase-like monooxygenase protein
MIAALSMQVSLCYFANDVDHCRGSAKYRLVIEGARFADEHGFTAVWTPERHFAAFGGQYPNPSVVSAALAMVTRRVGLRAGSAVAPLHDPLRLAEEWSVVDNLSDGRIGVAFASGWHAADFALAPERYAGRRRITAHRVDEVRRLWRGDAVCRIDGHGSPVEVRIHPLPVQSELPVWLTAAGTPDTFTTAGELGANVLTHLLGQDLGALAAKVRLYRDAWRGHGHPGGGHVTLMLHTYLDEDAERAHAVAREPFLRYLHSSIDLTMDWLRGAGVDLDADELDDDDLLVLAERSVDRHLTASGLFGTVETAAPFVRRLSALGIDEIACLVDFGVPFEPAMAGLCRLARLLAVLRDGPG